MSASIVQCWNGDREIPLQSSAESVIYPRPPRIGMVVGTIAAIPYIHLQLESRRRHFPHVPLLVHDDASGQGEALRELCSKYGCSFERNSQRLPPCLGDLSVFVGGLLWAQELGVELLLKLSRRWIFLVDWEASLRELAAQSQYATFCSYTTTFSFGFRTECVGMSVNRWRQADFLNDALRQIALEQSVFVEGYIHNFARGFERANCRQAEQWRAAHPMTEATNGYALWTLMGTDRCERSANFLWHDSASPADYARVAESWGLPYGERDFIDPNQGEGNGT